MKIATTNTNKLKKNIAINSSYRDIIIFEQIINATDFKTSYVHKLIKNTQMVHYNIDAKVQGSTIYGSLLRIISSSLFNIKDARANINKVKFNGGIEIIERKIINGLKKIICVGYYNSYIFSRSIYGKQDIEFRSRRGSFEITARIPLIPAKNAIHCRGGFISFAEALNESNRHRNFFMLGVTDMYEDTSDVVGDIRLGLITYFQTGKNYRHKGIQYAWMCMSKGKVCVVGLANDPVHAEKRMIRSAAAILREKIKEEST